MKKVWKKEAYRMGPVGPTKTFGVISMIFILDRTLLHDFFTSSVADLSVGPYPYIFEGNSRIHLKDLSILVKPSYCRFEWSLRILMLIFSRIPRSSNIKHKEWLLEQIGWELSKSLVVFLLSFGPLNLLPFSDLFTSMYHKKSKAMSLKILPGQKLRIDISF